MTGSRTGHTVAALEIRGAVTQAKEIPEPAAAPPAPPELVRSLEADGFAVQARADVVAIEVEGQHAVADVLKRVLEGGAEIVEVTPRRETLEDLFLRRAL